jgi:hypothetical protein
MATNILKWFLDRFTAFLRKSKLFRALFHPNSPANASFTFASDNVLNLKPTSFSWQTKHLRGFIFV